MWFGLNLEGRRGWVEGSGQKCTPFRPGGRWGRVGWCRSGSRSWAGVRRALCLTIVLYADLDQDNQHQLKCFDLVLARYFSVSEE